MINIPNIVDMINKIVNNTVNKYLGNFQEEFSKKLVDVMKKVIILPPEFPTLPIPEELKPIVDEIIPPELTDDEKKAIEDSGAQPPQPVGADVIWDKDGNLISDPNYVPPPQKPPTKFIPPVLPEPPASPEIYDTYPPETSTQVSQQGTTDPIYKQTLPGTYAPASTYRASAGIKQLIKESESLSLKLYKDPDGVHADVGYGHVIGLWANRASLPQTITVAQANAYFEQDIFRSEAAVKRMLRQKCTQGQFDSLLDLAYGAGEGWLANSQTLATFNRGDICGAGKLYQNAAVTGGGKPLTALKRRRMTIYNNFFVNNWGVKCP